MRKVTPPVENCADPTSACYASYWLRQGIDVHAIATDANLAPENVQLEAQINLSKQTSGAPVLAVVGGLQSFLQERAKEEALNYAVEQLKGRLCKQYKTYLTATCALLGKDDLELDEATLRRLRRALQKDLARLPGGLIDSLPASTDANELAMRAFGRGAANTFYELVANRLPAKNVPKTWAAKDKAAYSAIPTASRLTCSLQGGNGLQPPCFALLLPELGAAAADAKSVPTTSAEIAAVVEAAAVSFCGTYAPAGDEQQFGRCLLGDPEKYKPLAGILGEIVETAKRFGEIEKKIAALHEQRVPLDEIAEKVVPDIVEAFDRWNETLREVPGAATIRQPLDRIAVVLRAGQAVLEHDYGKLLDVFLESMEPDQSFAQVNLPPKVVASISFVVRLAAAKEPDDAKKVFEDAAAPLGTYKVKYGREDGNWTVALNSFVGPFAGYGKQYLVRDGRAPGFSARPISAPTGLDFTPSFLSWDNQHLGFMIPFIDPFGPGTIDAKSESADLDWGAIVTPGFFVRWGMFHSPFTVMGGVVGQPFAHGPKACKNGSGDSISCWKGAIQVGGAVSVDIPLLVLH